MKEYDVFGIGSAIMDFLIEIDESELIEMDLEKGSMQLIDEERSRDMLKKIERHKVTTSPGGSSANTLAGIASLGGSAVFCGKVGKDKHGDVYEQKSADFGVCSRISRHEKKPTGHAVTFITPDSERTFATHLGAAMHLEKEDVFDEDIAKSRILHVEGYQIENPKLRSTILHAVSVAEKSNTMVSIDLSDAALIKRNLAEFRSFVKEHADIVFANEKEAKAFSEKENENEALLEIAKLCRIAVVKLGEKGSIIKDEKGTYIIPPVKADAVDTTGAGDMYAAGVLFGIAKAMPLERAGRIGSWAASKVVSQVGARLNICLKGEVERIK